MSLARIAVMLITIGLVLCAVIATSEPEAASPDHIVVSGTTSTVHEIALKDGTRCVVLTQSRSGGITCNWASK